MNELNHTAHSDDYVCKINDFYRHYTHFARFSCRMCLYLIKIKMKPTSNLKNLASVKRKTDGIQCRKFRFKFRCSYIYNKVFVNLNQKIEGLIFLFKDACIYTWVNVNLNFIECNSSMFPRKLIFFFIDCRFIITT